MKLYVRQLAWLNSIPIGQEKTRLEQEENIAEFYNQEPEYNLPDVGDYKYLIDVLHEIGEAKLEKDSIIPISWVDLKAWADVTGEVLTPREYSALKSLSHYYVRQYNDSKNVNCQSPHLDYLPSREVVQGKLKSLFAMFKKD